MIVVRGKTIDWWNQATRVTTTLRPHTEGCLFRFARLINSTLLAVEVNKKQRESLLSVWDERGRCVDRLALKGFIRLLVTAVAVATDSQNLWIALANAEGRVAVVHVPVASSGELVLSQAGAVMPQKPVHSFAVTGVSITAPLVSPSAAAASNFPGFLVSVSADGSVAVMRFPARLHWFARLRSIILRLTWLFVLLYAFLWTRDAFGASIHHRVLVPLYRFFLWLSINTAAFLRWSLSLGKSGAAFLWLLLKNKLREGSNALPTIPVQDPAVPTPALSAISLGVEVPVAPTSTVSEASVPEVTFAEITIETVDLDAPSSSVDVPAPNTATEAYTEQPTSSSEVAATVAKEEPATEPSAETNPVAEGSKPSAETDSVVGLSELSATIEAAPTESVKAVQTESESPIYTPTDAKAPTSKTEDMQPTPSEDNSAPVEDSRTADEEPIVDESSVQHSEGPIALDAEERFVQETGDQTPLEVKEDDAGQFRDIL